MHEMTPTKGVVRGPERLLLSRLAEHCEAHTFCALPLAFLHLPGIESDWEVSQMLRALESLGLIVGDPFIGWKLTQAGWAVQADGRPPGGDP